MNKYILFSTCDLHNMGGVPYYYEGKARYLESIGWDVSIFHPGDAAQTCALPALNKYVVEGSLVWPSEKWRTSKRYRENYLATLAERILAGQRYDSVVIETHDYWTSPWVELLAKRLKAKHIIKELNEIDEVAARRYREYSGFYLFKLHRREHFCSPRMLEIIYRNVDGVTEVDSLPFDLDEDPVRDVENAAISAIEHCDWNIGYLGRANKGYVSYIIEGVCEFARNHPDHSIQFVTVGNFECRRFLYTDMSRGLCNLRLVELGDLSPLPRCFFDKVDVVIAGSGSARCTAYEGKVALVADAGNNLCNGALGYDTKESVYHHKDTAQMSFAEGLERVLVRRVYDDMEFDYPPKPGVDACCEQNLRAIAASNQTKRYYPARKLCSNEFGHEVERLVGRAVRAAKRVAHGIAPGAYERLRDIRRRVEKPRGGAPSERCTGESKRQVLERLMGESRGRYVCDLDQRVNQYEIFSPGWRRLTYEERTILQDWLIENYEAGMYQTGALGELEFAGSVDGGRIPVFSFWWQGWDEAPTVVRECRKAAEFLHEGSDTYQLIYVDRHNLGSYVKFPQWVFRRVERGEMSLTEMGNLVRLALLYGYGGIWMDATVFLTETLRVHDIGPLEYFTVRQTSKNRWNSSFLMCRDARSLFAAEVLGRYLEYWKAHDAIPYYYIFDVLIDMVLERHPSLSETWASIPVTNTHYEDFRLILNDEFDPETYAYLTSDTSIFKLSWKSPMIDEGATTSFWANKVAANR